METTPHIINTIATEVLHPIFSPIKSLAKNKLDTKAMAPIGVIIDCAVNVKPTASPALPIAKTRNPNNHKQFLYTGFLSSGATLEFRTNANFWMFNPRFRTTLPNNEEVTPIQKSADDALVAPPQALGFVAFVWLCSICARGDGDDIVLTGATLSNSNRVSKFNRKNKNTDIHK